jgi:hypothetical protein
LLEGQEILVPEGLVKDELRKAKVGLQVEVRDKIKQIDHLKTEHSSSQADFKL